MTTGNDLDADLETYPRTHVATLAMAPWIAQLDDPMGPAGYALLIPVIWVIWSGRGRKAAR